MTAIPQLHQFFLKCNGVSTDTRSVSTGQMFFALKGPNFNANSFASKALELGASFVVIDEEQFATDERCLLVPDVLTALQQLATFHRRTFDIPFIGITGSNGKTTTKELVMSVLAQKFRTHATFGNLNNHIGVPLTLLRMPLDTEIAVIEMGANKKGDIAELCAIAEPSHGLITNIGKAHLEGFGGLEGVKIGKSEMYRFLEKTEGTIFVNLDCDFLLDLSEGAQHRVFYGLQSHNSLLKVLSADPFVTVSYAGLKINSHLVGQYNYHNISTAIAVGEHFGVSLGQIKIAIEEYTPDNNRSQLKPFGENMLVMDCYNANPTSMANALRMFQQLQAPQKAVVLGEMLELGDESRQEHIAMAELVGGMGFQKMVFVGRQFAEVSLPAGALHFDDAKAAKAWFTAVNLSGWHILFKGSRGNRLEGILE